jgi:hypothetical protein
MSLEKNLGNAGFSRGQAIAEYIVLFTALAMMVVLVFGSLNPDKIGIRSAFKKAISTAVAELNKNE